jgi:hypothetical protein
VLRRRIEGWGRFVPRSQFSQYGPLATYFSKKFPRALIKPQAIVRPSIPEEDAALLCKLLGENPGILSRSEKKRARKLKEKLEKGSIGKASATKGNS